MRTVNEHLDAVLALAARLPSREVALADALGLTLAADVVARYPVPPFDNSAMDGFAVRAADVAQVPARIRVVADVPAGTSSSVVIGAGEAARIMTGAPLPQGADAVVPVELTDISPGPGACPAAVEVREGVAVGRHVRRAAEDAAPGDLALTAGTTLTPAALAAAASVGYATVTVTPRPRVAVISTGSELVAPGKALGAGCVPDSNSVLLAGLLRQWGAEVTTASASDDAAEFRHVLAAAAAGADLVITSGGVSAGAFEVVRQVASECEFVSVAMQPGKPQGFGRVAGVPLLAFPGNPVSVFVSAWLFARPVVAVLAGRTPRETWAARPAAIGWACPPAREQYVPVRIDDVVRPAHALGSGSHAIASLHLANGLARVPATADGVTAGQPVEVLFTDV